MWHDNKNCTYSENARRRSKSAMKIKELKASITNLLSYRNEYVQFNDHIPMIMQMCVRARSKEWPKKPIEIRPLAISCIAQLLVYLSFAREQSIYFYSCCTVVRARIVHSLIIRSFSFLAFRSSRMLFFLSLKF